MTEQEWLQSTLHWTPMLQFLRPRGSERQLYLFGCACCRRLWHLLEEAGQAAVEAAEQYADGRASKWFVRARSKDARLVEHLGWPSQEQRQAARATCEILTGETAYIVAFAADDLEAERKAQFLLVRDLFDRPAVSLPPHWRAWNGGKIVPLAEAAYAER
jgi:hypothetical protein